MQKNGINPSRNNISDFVINITAAPDGNTEGVIEHCQSGAVQHFRSCMELFSLIQFKLDEVGFPQSANEMRSWERDTASYSAREVLTNERKQK